MGGGPIDWVMKRQGVSFRHAVELLRADVGLAAGEAGAEPGARRRAKLPAPVALDAVISRDLLCAIFHPGGALHDGAVIVQGDRVAAARYRE